MQDSFEDLQNATAIDSDSSSNEHIDRMEPILKSEFPVVIAENEHLFYERMLKLPGTIVLYLHGNTASRGSGHRVDMYKLMRKLGYHVLTLDYRGYGDSDPVSPSEEGVVRDALAVYEYISNITSNPVIIWGHSLGTGVSTNLCAQLNYLNEKGPRGVILESPFTNIKEEIRRHPFARVCPHINAYLSSCHNFMVFSFSRSKICLGLISPFLGPCTAIRCALNRINTSASFDSQS